MKNGLADMITLTLLASVKVRAMFFKQIVQADSAKACKREDGFFSEALPFQDMRHAEKECCSTGKEAEEKDFHRAHAFQQDFR